MDRLGTHDAGEDDALVIMGHSGSLDILGASEELRVTELPLRRPVADKTPAVVLETQRAHEPPRFPGPESRLASRLRAKSLEKSRSTVTLSKRLSAVGGGRV